MNRFRPNIVQRIILIFLLLIIIFLFQNFTNFISNSNKEIDSSVNIGGSFTLTDHNNNQYSSRLSKKHKLIYFGYTFCPDVCPLDVLKLSKFYESNKQLHPYLDLIFISLDPDRDDIKTVNSFMENFHGDLIGLTGENSKIDDILSKFKVYKKKVANNEDESYYLIDHTALYYLMDKDDNYVTHFSTQDFMERGSKFFKEYKF